MDIEKLKEFADTIKHCGDYGALWVDEANNHVIWVAGDADFDTDEVNAGICTSWDDVIVACTTVGELSVVLDSMKGQ
jgi:predicted phosphodiesterase